MEHLPPDHAADAEPADLDRDRLALHQRDQGVRHHLRDDRGRARHVEPGDRLHDVQGDLRRKAGIRRSGRRDHAAVHAARDDLEHQALQERAGDDVVATRAETATLAQPRTLSERLVRAVTCSPVHIVLIAIAALWLVPTVALLVTSFRPRNDALSSGWWHVFSSHLTLANYSQVLHTGGMAHAFLNSLYITIPATVLPLTIGAMAAYAFAWTRFPFRDTVFLIVVALMVVPVQTAFVPLLKLFRENGHLNTEFYGIWLAHTAFGLPLAIFLFRNFFITLPKDLIEAARIDGASEFAVFRRVVIPLSVPALASFGIFQFLWVWNDLLMALVFLSGAPDKQPMTVKMTQILSTYGAEWNLLAAGGFLLMLLPLAVFFALQRYFVQGLLAGSVKS